MLQYKNWKSLKYIYESNRKSIYYIIFYRKCFQINNNNLLKNYDILKILCNIIV